MIQLSGPIQIPIKSFFFLDQSGVTEMLRIITHEFSIQFLPSKFSKILCQLSEGIIIEIEPETNTVTTYDNGARERDSILGLHKKIEKLILTIPEVILNNYYSFTGENSIQYHSVL